GGGRCGYSAGREARKHTRGLVRENELPDAWALPRPPREDGEEATENDISEGAPGLNPYPVRPRRPHALKTIREGGESEHDQKPHHTSPKLVASHSNSPQLHVQLEGTPRPGVLFESPRRDSQRPAHRKTDSSVLVRSACPEAPLGVNRVVKHALDSGRECVLSALDAWTPRRPALALLNANEH